MKKLYIVLLLNVWTILLWGQHRLGVSIGGMATYQFDNIEIATSKLGYGGEFGAIYQLQKKKFLFQTGLNVDYSLLLHDVDSISFSKDMVDFDGISYTYKSLFYNRIDKAEVIELSVPLMFGFNYSSFYLLLGPKFFYPLTAQTTQTALLTTYGDYNGMFYENFEDMPQHGYVKDQYISSKGKIDFLYDVRACVELGGSWNLSSTNDESSHLALGVFAEYGILNVLKGGNNELANIDYSQCVNSKLNHIYSTTLTNNAFVNNFRMGLRVTLLFHVAGDSNARKNKKCMCIDYINRKHPVYRKRR